MVLGGAQVSATPKKSTHCALCKYIYISPVICSYLACSSYQSRGMPYVKSILTDEKKHGRQELHRKLHDS